MNKDNTYIFVILGNYASEDAWSFNESNIKKYTQYSLSSYSILIKRLAMQHLKIKEDHIRIFAKILDKKVKNNISTIYKKVVVQLTLDEIYISDPKDHELEFTEFQNNEELFMSINQILGDEKAASDK